MKIGIELDRNDFMYDIHSLVKSFYPDDEVSVYTAEDKEKAEMPRNLVFSVAVPSYDAADRKQTKDRLKQELYRTLSAMTGQELPWGMLSGIRPTRIPMKMLSEGAPREDILRHLTEDDFVSPEKAELAVRVAEKERSLLAPYPQPADTYSLYLHIPFCPSICSYCTFSSNPAGVWADKIDAYLEAMLEEMREKAEMLRDSGRGCAPVSVYIGGGTPTALSAAQLDRVLGEIHRVWDTSHLAEFTVEAGRPDSITEDRLSVLKEGGVTRISVNPQTMNDRTLERIGRRHTAADTVRAYRMARAAGFDNINMDIILGLPEEGEKEVRHTLDRIRELSPDSLTVHSLALKRASRLRQQIRESGEAGEDGIKAAGLAFLDAGRLMAMAEETASLLSMEPYYLYRQKNMRGNLENTSFARPGKE